MHRHCHRHQNLGVASAGIGQSIARCRMVRGSLHRSPGQAIGEERQYHEDECAAERSGPYQRVKGKTDGEIERQPWQVEQGGGPGARQYRPYRIEVADRLQSVAAPAGAERQAYHQLVNTVAEPPVDLVSDPDQHAAPGNLQDALEDEKQRGNDTQPDEGRHAAAWQDAVIHFQHEQRAGQAQEIDQSAECGNADQCSAT